MKQIALDSSLNELSIDLLNVQIGSATSFVFVCIKFIWKKYRWEWLHNGIIYDGTRGELEHSQ